MNDRLRRWRFDCRRRSLLVVTPWFILHIGSDFLRDMIFNIFLGVQPRWVFVDERKPIPYAMLVEFSAGFPRQGWLPYQTRPGEWVIPYHFAFRASPWPVEYQT